jgi:hypothetical protein
VKPWTGRRFEERLVMDCPSAYPVFLLPYRTISTPFQGGSRGYSAVSHYPIPPRPGQSSRLVKE